MNTAIFQYITVFDEAVPKSIFRKYRKTNISIYIYST